MDAQLLNEKKMITAERINSLTVNVMEELAVLWYDLYEPSVVEKNITLLEQHVKTLYDDITNESAKRREMLQNDVDRLLVEASDLKRLLKVDRNLMDEDQDQMALHTFKTHLDDALQGLRIQLKERHDEIEGLLLQQNEICNELGEAKKALDYDPLPSVQELKEFHKHLQTLFDMKEERLIEFKELRKNIREGLEMLELENLSAEDVTVVNGKKVQYSKANLQRLHAIRNRLTEKCKELRRQIDQTRDKVRNLWKCLETPEEDRDKLEYYKDYHRTTYDMWRQELDRCETEKRQNLKKFVDKVRQELLIMWEKTLKSDEEKRRFKYFTTDVYSDDLIRIHEIELEELAQFYNDNENIFTLVAERKIMWAQMEKLENKASAPNRFNNRGGQLLREEKERKQIAHRLPKIEQELTELVQAFEATYKRPFTVYGQSVLEMINEQWEKKRAEKRLLTARKKEPAAVMTPGRKVTGTPLPSRTINSSVAASRMAAPNTTCVATALKRKMAPTARSDAPAKRNILGDLNSPRPAGKTQSAKAKKPIAAIHIAQMKRRSSGRMKKKSGQHHSGQNPHTSVSYDMFEEFIAATPSNCRSSEVVHQREDLTKLKTPSRISKKYTEVTPLRQKTGTRMMLRRLSENADVTTPGRGIPRVATTPGTSAAASTTHGNLSRISPRTKLSTKELPIIF